MAKKQITNKSNKTVKAGPARQIPNGRVYVTATFNNTLVTLTDDKGNALAWSSSGNAGFKGARKATPFAAITAVENVVGKAKEHGMGQVDVFIKGPGPGRDASIRALRSAGLGITMIADITPVPHNGPRAKKKRRI
jgi:small subunit ribosomal protein S11